MQRETTVPRLMIAFVVAPVMTPLFFFGITRLSAGLPSSNMGESLLITLLFAYGAAIILGIPLILVLQALNKVNALHYLSGGALVGFIVPLLLIPLMGFNLMILLWPFIFAIPGAISAFTFWLIAYQKGDGGC